MAIIEFIFEGKCKHCSLCRTFFKGNLKRHKCMVGAPEDESWTFKYVAEYPGKEVRLKDKSCENIKL